MVNLVEASFYIMATCIAATLYCYELYCKVNCLEQAASLVAFKSKPSSPFGYVSSPQGSNVEEEVIGVATNTRRTGRDVACGKPWDTIHGVVITNQESTLCLVRHDEPQRPSLVTLTMAMEVPFETLFISLNSLSIFNPHGSRMAAFLELRTSHRDEQASGVSFRQHHPRAKKQRSCDEERCSKACHERHWQGAAEAEESKIRIGVTDASPGAFTSGTSAAFARDPTTIRR